MRTITQQDWIFFIILWIIVISGSIVWWYSHIYLNKMEKKGKNKGWKYNIYEIIFMCLTAIVPMSIVSILSYIPYHYLLAPINETINYNVTWW